jgi:hypothetical protein
MVVADSAHHHMAVADSLHAGVASVEGGEAPDALSEQQEIASIGEPDRKQA